jgi:Na+/H+ antiporter NhaC
MSHTEQKEQKKYAETYGGLFGGVLPLIVMIVAMIVLAAFGMRSTKNFWSAGFLAVIVGFLVYKDKERFQAALIAGVRDQIFAFMLSCFLFAGLMAKILTASHLVSGLLWITTMINLSPGLMPLLCFFVCVVLSSATGTAGGAMATAAPVLIPISVAMGCNVNLVCGAILSGCCFGDNLAPISDTTIASSLSQEVNVIRVVKSRLKYSLVAGIASAVAFIIVGLSTTNAVAAQALTVDSTYASSLLFLIVPVIVIVLMLRKANLFTALIISEIVGIVMLFAFGYMDFSTLVAKDGLIASAFDGMLSAIIFIMFIFMVVSLIREAGVLDKIMKVMLEHAKSERSAEIASGAMVSVMSIAISSGTTAITFCGPIIRSLLRPFKIDRARAANFLDGLGCGVGYLVPTNAGCLGLAAFAVAAGVVTEGYNAIEFIGYNFHSMALVIVFWFAILSGWGRKHETDEELAADGIVIETDQS